MPNIVFKNVDAFYLDKKKRATKVIEQLNCEFKNEKITVILGYSGCGKTTLLRTIIDSAPYSGDITIDGEDIESLPLKDRNIGYISQRYALYPSFSVFENIAFPLKNLHAPIEEIKERVLEISKKLGIDYCLSRKPKHLSGGQQQRVALARALIKKPNICLFDEPLSNLDPETAMEARLLIKEILSEEKITTIYVTHNLDEAFSLADYIYVMDEGKMVFYGNQKQFMKSNNEVIQNLLRAKNGKYSQ